jgi:hypothetical protein
VAGFRAQLREPVHAVIDVLGGPALRRQPRRAASARTPRDAGIPVLLGSRTDADLSLVLRHRSNSSGTVMRSRSLAERVRW